MILFQVYSGGPLWSYLPATNERIIQGVVSNTTSSQAGTPLYNEFTRITQSRFNDIGRWITEDNSTRRPTDKADLVDYDEWFNTSFANSSVSAVDPGDSFTLRSVVRNNGTAVAGGFTVSFYASGDADLSTSADNYFIGDTTISALTPFNFTDAIWQGACPNIPRGNYYIGWHIDTGNTVQEFVENNNRGITNSRVLIDPNNAPTDILIHDLQTSYNGKVTVNLNQVFAFDKDGFNDLSRIDFQLQTPTGSQRGISDATSFSPWEGGSRRGKTSYSFSLSGLSPGTHSLWGKAYDRAGLGGNIFQKSFTITDTVESNVNFSLGFGFKNLILTGIGNINGTGNSLDNTITGNTGDNILDGGVGIDILTGGLANDTYIVDSTTDSIREVAGEGAADTVKASVNYTLGANDVENLTLTGSALIGLGNTLSNTITGNGTSNTLKGDAGNDTVIGGGGNDLLVGGPNNNSLYGGAGNDTLNGATGADRLVFKSKAEGRDMITNFSVVEDTIEVSKAGFGGELIAGAAITAAQFRLGSAAGDSSDRFIYNKANGALLFDPTGNINGVRDQVQFATLSTNLAMTNADIFVIA